MQLACADTGGYPKNIGALNKTSYRKMSLVKVNEKCCVFQSRTARSGFAFALLVDLYES